MKTEPIPYSYWLVDGVLLAGRYPGAFDRETMRENLASFLDAGIRTFVDLTEPDEPLAKYDSMLQELAAERKVETKYVRLPIPDRDVPSERDLMTRILTTIRDEIAAGHPVYVHCWGGIGRTGTVIGCWLVEEGLAGPEAVERIAELRQHTPDRRVRSPETDAQCSYICEWKPERRR